MTRSGKTLRQIVDREPLKSSPTIEDRTVLDELVEAVHGFNR